jgi:hypothetical protein
MTIRFVKYHKERFKRERNENEIVQVSAPEASRLIKLGVAVLVNLPAAVEKALFKREGEIR